MRLDALQREVADSLTVEWRAFLLRPFAQQRSLTEFTRYTERWGRPAAMEPGTTFRTWSGEHAPPSHSVPSAVAGKAVLHEFGAKAFERFHLSLMYAYFAENRTVSDRPVILDVAAASALDAARLAARLDGDGATLEAEVLADHRSALALGISGVPTVVVDDKYLLQGAMTIEQYRRVTSRLAG